MPGKIEKAIEDLRELLSTKDRERLNKRKNYEDILKEFNKAFSFLSINEKEEIKEKYKHELEFLEGITDKNIRPSTYISNNHRLLNEIIGNAQNIDFEEENIDEVEPNVQENGVKTNKYLRELDQNIDELSNIADNYEAILLTYSKDTLPQKKLEELDKLKIKLEEIASFFRNGSNAKNQKIDTSLFDDKRHESLELLNDIKIQMISIEIDDKYNYILNEVKTVEDNNQNEYINAKEYIEEKISKLKSIKGYLTERSEYYTKNSDDKAEIKKIKTLSKINELNNLLEKAENHAKNLESVIDYHEETHEEVVEVLEQEESSKIIEENDFKNEEISVEYETTLKDDDYFNNLLEANKKYFKDREEYEEPNIDYEFAYTNSEEESSIDEEKIIEEAVEETKNIDEESKNILDFQTVNPEDYLNEKTQQLVSEKRKFNSIQKVKIRGLLKKIYADNEKFKGDTFFDETYKIGMFDKKPKLFTGKISNKNAEILNELIEKFDSCKNELSKEDIECFIDFVLNPVLANKELGKLQNIKYEKEEAVQKESTMISEIKEKVKSNIVLESEEYEHEKSKEREDDFSL